MVYPKNGWLHRVIQSAIAASVVAVFAVGCASSPPAPSGSTADAATVQTLGDVSVSRVGDDSVIWLEGLADPIYSVSMPDDANLIVVDLVGVDQLETADESGAIGDEGRQIATYDGVVDLITLATFDQEGETPLTRLEIVMAAEGRAEVFSTGDGLEIRVIPGAEEADMAASAEGQDGFSSDTGSEDEMMSEPWGAGDAQAFEGMESDVDSSEVMISMTPPPAASQLTAVSAELTETGVLVALEADGAIGNLEAFTLSDPARLVIDLPGMTAGEASKNISLDSTLVTGVRLGSHDGKVRVVLDGGSEVDEFQGRQIMPGATGLWIAIGDGDALAQAMTDAVAASEAAWMASAEPASEEIVVSSTPASIAETLESDEANASDAESMAFEPEVAAVPVEESLEEVAPIEDASMAAFELAEIYGLHYERTDGMDRTAILADEAVPYTMTTPDDTTVVISLPSAQISEEASDRIFPNTGGPVSLIHAFQQPDVDVPEVRVVFTRAPNQMPVVSRRGSMLFVDFEDMGVAAAPPPAFPNAGMADDGTAAGMNMVAVEALGTMTSDEIDEEALLATAAGSSTPAEASMASSMMDETSPVEVATELPNFDNELEVASLPASLDTEGSVWDAPMDAAGAPAAVEVPAAIEVLEEGGLIDGKEYRGRRVSLDFKDVEIADVLRLIAEVSDLNIIAGDEVAGNVTIRLVEVPWDQALDVILMTKGLGFVRVGNVLRIAPSEVLKAEEEVRLQERRNKEKLEDLEVKLLPVNYAAVKDVVGLVKRLLSARGTVNLDERTNTLIIKDISSIIDEASALIAAIDTQTPQVMIEAKIVEANLGFSRELGSVWSIQTQQYVDPFNPDTPRTDLGSEDLRFIDNNSLAFANPITAIPNGLMNFGALILDEDFRVDAQVQAAESTGDGKVISSPRIVTLDNKEAKIEQGVSIPFQTFEGGDAKLEFIDAVLSLTVTPHITADESIIMEIEVTRNSPDDTVSTPTGSPAIAKNVAETETLVKDGQTLVLGGIYTIIKSERQSRVPYMWRIPVIGNMFKMNSITDARKEMLVFVTPRIVRLPEMASN
jgi:type IV pilus secretin PilQ/predicted competence protein